MSKENIKVIKLTHLPVTSRLTFCDITNIIKEKYEMEGLKMLLAAGSCSTASSLKGFIDNAMLGENFNQIWLFIIVIVTLHILGILAYLMSFSIGCSTKHYSFSQSSTKSGMLPFSTKSSCQEANREVNRGDSQETNSCEEGTRDSRLDDSNPININTGTINTTINNINIVEQHLTINIIDTD